MTRQNLIKLVGAVLGIAVAAFFLVRYFTNNSGLSDKAYFYDLSEKKLFTGPRSAIPPIRGINDDEEDGVGALVISTSGDPADKKSRKIAYLEKYSTELKRDLEQAQKTGKAAQIGRSVAQGLRFVRSESDTAWHSLATEEGNRIVTSWATPGANGITPVICNP